MSIRVRRHVDPAVSGIDPGVPRLVLQSVADPGSTWAESGITQDLCRSGVVPLRPALGCRAGIDWESARGRSAVGDRPGIFVGSMQVDPQSRSIRGSTKDRPMIGPATQWAADND